MKKIFTLMAVAVAALVSASCDKNENDPVEEKIVKVTNYVIVYGDEDIFKFYDLTLNYKCGSEQRSEALKIGDMTYTYKDSDKDEIHYAVSFGFENDKRLSGKFKVIPINTDFSKPYDLSVSIDAKVKDIADFPAPGNYNVSSYLTGLCVMGVTNTGFCGEGTIWSPGTSIDAIIPVSLTNENKQDVYRVLEEHILSITRANFYGARITVSGKNLSGVPAN